MAINSSFKKSRSGITDEIDRSDSDINFKRTEQKGLKLEEINKKFDGKIITKITQDLNYVRAEDYHQKYFEKKGIV